MSAPFKHHSWFSATNGGAMIWAEVLYQEQTSFGDIVRVVGTPHDRWTEESGCGIGIGWNDDADDDDIHEWGNRIKAIYELMCSVQDTKPSGDGARILDTFFDHIGALQAHMFRYWRGDPTNTEGATA